MNAWRVLRKLPLELWIVSFASLVNRSGTMAMPFLVLYLTRSLGFSLELAGATLAIYGVTALLTGPIAGKLADRFGMIWIMQAALIASGLVLLAFPLAQSLLEVWLMTILFAVTNEAFRPANLALIGILGPTHLRKPAFALHRLAVNLGMGIGPAAGGFLAQWSFPSLFIIDGLTTLAAAGILGFPFVYRMIKAREVEAHTAQDAPPPGDGRNTSWPMRPFFADRTIRVFVLGILPVAIVFFQHESTMPLFLVRNLHLSESAYGMIFAVNTLMIITMEIPLNAATAHWPHARAFAVGSMLFGLGFGALAFARDYVDVVLTVVIWTFGEMILFPAMSAYVSEIAPKRKSGEYMGLYMMAFNVAFTAAPAIGALALERLGALPLWIGAFMVAAVSAVLLGRTPNAKI